jgi:PilZ domain
MNRRSFTPTPPTAEGVHGTRRSGGARHEASERIIVRRPGFETTGWSLNMSRSGVRVVVEDPVEPGQEYDLLIGAAAEADGPVRRGRVVWVQDEADGQIVGVQFLDGEGPPPEPPKGSP